MDTSFSKYGLQDFLFYLWGCLKSVVYATAGIDVTELQAVVEYGC
jgi:hypothetical protein